MRHRPTVSAARWKRGVLASQRVGDWLKSYEDRARRARDGEDPLPRPPRRRRSRPGP